MLNKKILEKVSLIKVFNKQIYIPTKLPREQTVAAKDIFEREMVLIQVMWGTSTERNMKRYRKFYVLIQEFFMKVDIDLIGGGLTKESR